MDLFNVEEIEFTKFKDIVKDKEKNLAFKYLSSKKEKNKSVKDI